MPMARPSGLDAGFVLDEWIVRPRHGTLQPRAAADAPPVELEPRVMAVLVCLAARAGQVVSRDEFIAEVWGGRIVTDDALSRTISVLRQSLRDDSHVPRYIRTVPKVGYTLLVAPQPLESAAPAAAPVGPVPVAHAPPRRRWWWAGIAAGALALALALVGLWQLRRAPPPSEPPPPSAVARLAVLPFDTHAARDFGRDVGDEMADEIAAALGHLARLRISGRESARKVFNEHLDPAQAGRRLGVDYLLEGAVEQGTEGLRIHARLIATGDGSEQWAHDYAAKPAEIFGVQYAIASSVAHRLGDNPEGVTPPEPDSRDIDAYHLYLRGAHQVRLRGEDSLRKAVELFAAATRRDPGYARAYVGLASAYALLPSYSDEDATEMYALADKALAAAERAGAARALTAGVRGYLAFRRWRWIEAETAYRTALTAEPNNPDVRQLFSQLLGVLGREDAALEQARLAHEIDPLAPVVADRIGVIHLWRGEDAEAGKFLALAHELGLEESAYPETKVILHLHEHADEDAAEGLRRLQRTLNRDEAWIEPTIAAIRHAERRPAAIALLEREQRAGNVSPRVYFGAMVLLGSPARAVRAFEGLIDRDPNDIEFLFSNDAAAVRRDAVFGPFVQKIGLVGDWDRFGWPAACRRTDGVIACH